MSWAALAHEDSDVVRGAFREAASGGALLIAAIASFHSVVFLGIGDSHWWETMVLAVVCLGARRFYDMRVVFSLFLFTLLLMIAATWIVVSTQARRYGSDAAFQFLLLAIAPVIVVSGRIGTWTKWALVILLVLGVLYMDHRYRTGPAPGWVGAETRASIEMVRAVNLLALGVVTPSLLFHYFRIITRQQALLIEASIRDPLTALFNRRYASECWSKLVSARTSQGLPVSVVLFDLDHFKRINDEWGHDVGDSALRHSAQLVGQEARSSDVVCRWGGEEFLVIQPNTPQAAAMAFAERVREKLATTPLVIRGRQLTVTGTFGVACDFNAESLDGLVDRADKLLYEGKRAGRNRVLSERRC